MCDPFIFLHAHSIGVHEGAVHTLLIVRSSVIRFSISKTRGSDRGTYPTRRHVSLHAPRVVLPALKPIPRHAAQSSMGDGRLTCALPGAPHATPPLSTIWNTRLQAASSDTHYDPKVPCGRTRPDGVEIKWDASMPARWEEEKGTSRMPLSAAISTSCELQLTLRCVPNISYHLTERI